MKQFYGLKYNKNILNLDVYITNKCNFKCNYCYMNKNNDDMSLLNAIKSVNFIKRCDLQVIPCLLGGEPLLNIKILNFLIDQYNKLKNVKHITITTNGSIDIKKVSINNKVKFIFSYHYQYFDKFKNQFLNNINYCINNKIPYLISIQYKDDINFNSLINYNLYVNPISNTKTNSKQYDNLMSLYQIKNGSNVYQLNERQIIQLKLNSFKNWRCYLRWYNFNIDGTITAGCNNQINYYKDYIKCPNNYCSCGVASLENLKCN